MTRLPRVSSEEGFTLIEVMVAVACLALVLTAATTIFFAANNGSVADQRRAEEINVADQAIENIREQLKTSSSFANLAMTTLPSGGSNTTIDNGTVDTDPNDFVTSCSSAPSGKGYLIESDWDGTTSGTIAPGVGSWSTVGCPSGAEPLVVSSSGFVSASQSVTIGSASGTEYTYVTDTNVGCYAGLGSCYSGGSYLGDAKRVIVAIVLNNGGSHNSGSGANYRLGQNSPVYVSTIFTNPVPSNQSNQSVGITLGLQLG